MPVTQVLYGHPAPCGVHDDGQDCPCHGFLQIEERLKLSGEEPERIGCCEASDKPGCEAGCVFDVGERNHFDRGMHVAKGD